MTIDPEILKRLDALGAKLGVTADHLWAVLIRQAHVELLSSLILIVLFGVTIYVLVRLCRKFIKSAVDAGTWDGDGWVIGAILTGATVVVVVVITINALASLPTLMFNPEYWALKQILAAL